MWHTVKTSTWINFKNLRFFALQYLMLVVIFPCSYLMISLISSDAQQSAGAYTIGLFISMVMSLFVNMQASSIASSNNISTLELYATYKVRPLFVHSGGCVYHALISIPLFIIVILANLLGNAFVNVWLLLVTFGLSILLLSCFSMVLGGIFHNPNIAAPMINMIYMVLMMITPLYGDLSNLHGILRIAYCLNPFSHICSLMEGSFGMGMLCNQVVSIIYLSVLTVLFSFMAYKRWYRCYAVEKLGI